MELQDQQLFHNYQNHRFKSYFTRSYVPNWHCPHCMKGTLWLDPKNLSAHETQRSKAEHSDEYWQPWWVDERFTAVFKCTQCSGITICTGSGGVDVEGDAYSDEIKYESYYTPHYFEPTISLFQVPEKSPDDVKKVIQASFALAWLDLSATGNKLRVAIEKLVLHIDPSLDQYGRLHRRLKVLKQSQPEIAELLLAIKWLGNDASHEDSLVECDIAFAYKTIEEVLRRLYPSPSTDILALARLVNTHEKSPMKSINC